GRFDGVKEFHSTDGVSGKIQEGYELMPDLSTLDGQKKYVRDQIDAQTEAAIFTGFEFDGLTFSMSLTAQINWSNFPVLPESLFPLPIMSKFDEPYSLAYSDKMAFYMAALNHKNTALQAGNVKKKVVNDCTTVAELEQVAAGYGITI